MDWACILAYVTGMVDQELLARNEYLATLGTDDREDPQGRRKPSIQLDEETAVVVCKPDPTPHIAPQNN